jgi:hypothetical protein
MDCETGAPEGGPAQAALGPQHWIGRRGTAHLPTALRVLDGLSSLSHVRIDAVAAEAHAHWGAVSSLIERRYRWRGYPTKGTVIDASCPHRMTLTASSGRDPVGTITVGVDGPMPLTTEQTFPQEVQQLRERGHALCEFSRLAIDPSDDSKAVLAGLFHVAYIIAFRIHGCDTLVFEVNPRHVRFYARLLGSTVFATGRHNAGVNAPSVLLGLDLHHAEAMIAELGGRPLRAMTEKTLYPYAFSKQVESEIVGRLRRRVQRPGHAAEAALAREYEERRLALEKAPAAIRA